MFSRYGLKEHKGRKLLSGPGLVAGDIPGMMEGGGKWEARLRTLCLEIIEEHEEEGVYDFYKELGPGNLSNGLCLSYCNNKKEILSLKQKEAESSSEKTEL
ncbi:marginal zone B- and B1-cell-specific protein-like [Elysia marginata]|uniref:Marginal zone B- and B1-cell-specific protein-like n=1 Tax=Elysia marginata TaxID=1093978 RepID=A0AAV4HR79_9GAST|nr:marginal zone B- and B1-cell-specific protein-like [Elysia marginata]